LTAPGWYSDPEELKRRVVAAGGFESCSRTTGAGVPATTLKSAWARYERQKLLPPLATLLVGDKPGVRRKGDEAELTSIRGEAIDEAGLMARHGFSPDEWLVRDAVVNEWTSGEQTNQQVKLFLRKRVTAAMLVPANVQLLPQVPSLRKQRKQPVSLNKPKLVFVYGDDQRPNVEPTFEQHKLEWVTAHQPDVIVDLGDGMDFPTVSGHKPNPAMGWSVQECADNYATWLYRLRNTAPDAKIVVLADNHVTGRFRDYQLAQAKALYGITPAEIDGLKDDLEPLLSIRRLLRLDELGVEYLAPELDGHYARSHYEIVPGELVAIHGYRTGANLGKKFVEDHGCSVIYGHAHGQDLYVTDTARRGIGRRRRLYGIGVGCGMNPMHGGDFAPGADWQNCALTVSVFPDGGWTFDYMGHEHGVTRWRDESYGTDLRLAA
jgi:hypothetical protein